MNALKFFYILVYGFLFIIVGAAVSGCQEDIKLNPTVTDTTIESRTETAFLGKVDGFDRYMPDSIYTCVVNQTVVRAPVIDPDSGLTVNPGNGLVLLDAVGTQIPAVDDQGYLIMYDGVIDTCDPKLVAVTSTANTIIRIFRGY